MLALLMTFDHNALQHVRTGKPDELNVLIHKAKRLAHLWPYITDHTGRTIWADPNSVSQAVKAVAALYGPSMPRARHRPTAATIVPLTV